VLQDPEHRFRKSAPLDLLWSVIAEVVAAFGFDIRAEQLVDELSWDPSADQSGLDLRQIHSDQPSASPGFRP
jgi:hypothetical protein